MVGASSILQAQHLTSSRGVGLGAYTSLVSDLSSIDWNAAGLTGLKDWEISMSNTLAGRSSQTVSLQSFGVGKRFLERHSFALRYAPGHSLEFIVPSLFNFGGGSQQIAFDKRIAYREVFGFAYGYRLADEISIGVGARYREEQVTETQPFIEQDTIARIRTLDYTASSWNFDLGMQYRPSPFWRLAVVAKGLFKMNESELPYEIRPYAFRARKYVRLGVGYLPLSNHRIVFDVTNRGEGALGWEWDVARTIAWRQGVYFGSQSLLEPDAVSVGIGWRSGSFRMDLSYLHVLNPPGRKSITVQDFVQTGVSNIGYNKFTPSQLLLTVSVPLGRTRDPLARIEHVQILSEVYPSSFQIHAYRPLGKARVRNVTDAPVEAKVAFFVDRFMDAPTETKPYLIPPKSDVEIPFFAVFNEAVRSVSKMVLRAGDVFVTASTLEGYEDKFQTQLIIRGKNDWDGDVLSLRYFVTPDDPDVLAFTRSVVNRYRDSLAVLPRELTAFRSAMVLFQEFSKRLSYVQDPRTSKDRVQFPSETLSLRGGDCDDMAVGFASLLASVGIAPAFVDVVPPEKPDEAHIYLLFDTGVPAQQAELISKNPKRYVKRKNEQGIETVWIPLETTVITEGFEQAWEVGAREYYDDVEIGLGLIKGWVRIVDIPRR